MTHRIAEAVLLFAIALFSIAACGGPVEDDSVMIGDAEGQRTAIAAQAWDSAEYGATYDNAPEFIQDIYGGQGIALTADIEGQSYIVSDVLPGDVVVMDDCMGIVATDVARAMVICGPDGRVVERPMNDTAEVRRIDW